MDYQRLQNNLIPSASLQSNNQEQLLKDCKGKTFLQFNNIIGLPRKTTEDDNGITKDVEYPIFDYEIQLVKDILTYQHVWVLKAAGLGITEIVLRFLAWVCLCDPRLEGKQIHIISGTGMYFANDLKVRLEKLFERNYPDLHLESKFTELILNKTRIKVFPTKQIKDLRGHIDISYIFIDEADYYDKAEQDELPYVIKRYEEKSRAKIIMVSTPNRPDGLFHAIETGLVFRNFFHQIKLGYEVGLNKIYDTAFIEREKNEPEFQREYNLQYLGKIGNVFFPQMIDDAIALGESLKHVPITQDFPHVGGIDTGYSKTTPIYIAEFDKVHSCVRIIWWKRLDQTTQSEIADIVWQKHREFLNLKWFVDASDRGLINQLKVNFNESQRWNNPAEVSLNKHIIPVNFGARPSTVAKEKAAVEGHEMLLEHLHNLLSKRKLAIPKECTELITALKTATATEWSLDKENTVYDDDLDAVRCLLKEIKIT